MSQAAPKKMTVEEFFAWQEKQDKNYELVDGLPVLTVKAITGASRQHDRITVSAIATLHQALRGKPCAPATSDISLRTVRGTRRPDITVDCGPSDRRATEASEPRVVIEILSPSTMRFDRFQKVLEYQQHPAIRVILLVDSEAPRVDIHRRTESGWQLEEAVGLDASISLPEIDAALPLSELYADVTFED